MTIETEDYATIPEMKRGKNNRLRNGWRSFHTDFINNKESDGYHVTFVNGRDDPDKTPQADQDRLDFQRQKALKEKLMNDTISDSELRELLRARL